MVLLRLQRQFSGKFCTVFSPDGGRARPATFAVNGRNCVIDDWMFRVCRRRSAERAAQPEPRVELVSYMNAPIYFRDEPRPARGGMPRFATQAEADAAHASAMAGLSSDQMTWEDYAAAHPNESVGVPPLPDNSRSFSERRECYYKSANDFPSPDDPPDSVLLVRQRHTQCAASSRFSLHTQ
jgi:hypothetical protein